MPKSDQSSSSKKDVIEIEGTVLESLPNAVFRVKLDGQENEILGTISGKMRMFHIRLLPGDRVKMELSPYDLSRGRITFRYKKERKPFVNNSK